MAVNLGELNVELGVDSSGLTRGMQDTRRLGNDLSKTFRRLAATIATAFSLDAIRRTALLADSMKILDVRIKQATKTNDEFVRSQQKLIQISKGTGTALEGSVKLFEALKFAGEDLGATNEQVLRMTESLQKLGVAGGASADDMKNSLRQFGQAMAGGIVRAEEWNSVVENTPLIANTIAKGLGKSIGQLRLMVIEGKVLSEDVFNSLLKQTDMIDAKFDKFPMTIARASNALSVSFGQAIKDINENVAFTDIIVEGIQAITDVVENDLVGGAFNVFNVFKSIKDVVKQIDDRWVLFSDSMDSSTSTMDTIKNIASFILDSIIKFPNNFAALFTVVLGFIDQTLLKVNTFFEVWDLGRDKLRVSMFAFFEQAGVFFQKTFFKAIDKVRAKLADALELGQGTFEFLGLKNIDKTIKGLRDISATSRELIGVSTGITLLKELELAKIDKIIEKTKFERDFKIAASKEAVDEMVADSQRLNAELDQASFERTKIFVDEQNRQKLERERLNDISDVVPVLGEIDRELTDKQKKAADKKRAADKKAAADKLSDIKAQGDAERSAVLGSATSLSGDLLRLMEQSGKEQTALGKALFLANKAFQVATIINNTLVGASVHAANPAVAAFITATGFAQAGIVAGSGIAEAAGRQHGGDVGGNMLTPINENGEPELLVQGSKQFLLTGDKGGRVTSANNMRVGGDSSSPNIIINNNASGVVVSPQSVTREEIVLMVSEGRQGAVDEVNSSLATGRGSTSNALQSSFNMSRRR